MLLIYAKIQSPLIYKRNFRMAETGNTTRTQLINLEGLSAFLEESKKIFEPTLTASVGGTTEPIYFNAGKPTKTGYTFESTLSTEDSSDKIPTSSAVASYVDSKIRAADATWATAGAIPDPQATSPGWGWIPSLHCDPSCCSWILNPLRHSRNSGFGGWL